MVVMERRYECPATAGCEGDAQARQITIRTLLSRGTRARAWLRSTSTRAAGVGQRFVGQEPATPSSTMDRRRNAVLSGVFAGRSASWMPR
jgi:hypothetical protein